MSAFALAGCGTERRAADVRSSPTDSTTTGELSCEQLPPAANCPGPAPPRPVAMSPDGPVRSYKAEYMSAEQIISENGVYAVAATAPRTFAVSGTVADGRSTRPPYDLPIEGATVTFSSVEGTGLPQWDDIRVTTTTGYDGAFAVIDVPVAKEGTCYRMTVVAPGVGQYESFDVVEAGVYDQSIELSGGTERASFPYPTRGKQMVARDRACAAAAGQSH